MFWIQRLCKAFCRVLLRSRWSPDDNFDERQVPLLSEGDSAIVPFFQAGQQYRQDRCTTVMVVNACHQSHHCNKCYQQNSVNTVHRSLSGQESGKDRGTLRHCFLAAGVVIVDGHLQDALQKQEEQDVNDANAVIMCMEYISTTTTLDTFKVRRCTLFVVVKLYFHLSNINTIYNVWL